MNKASSSRGVIPLQLALQWELYCIRQAREQKQYDARRRHLCQVIWCGLALSYLLLARTLECTSDCGLLHHIVVIVVVVVAEVSAGEHTEIY